MAHSLILYFVITMSPTRHLKLSELLSSVQRCIDELYGGVFWIKAETSDVKVSGLNGHCYMELIEKGSNGSTIAKVRANLWKNTLNSVNSKFQKAGLNPITSGIDILCLVRVQFHPQYGFSLTIEDVDPTYSLGEIAKLKQQTIAKLKSNGLFDCNKSLPYPQIIKKVALITSKSAAGRGDFITHISESNYGKFLQIALFPALMQGDNVTTSIKAALSRVYEYIDLFDCVVIIRGGGAVSELRAFDDYELCEFLAQFPLPIITGIGHERDSSVADMIASVSEKTPTAVADYLIKQIKTQFEELEDKKRYIIEQTNLAIANTEAYFSRIFSRIPNLINEKLRQEDRRITIRQQKLSNSSQSIINNAMQRIEVKKIKLSSFLLSCVSRERDNIGVAISTLRRNIDDIVRYQDNKLNTLEQFIRLSHPDNILKKGYVAIYMGDKIITSSTNLKDGDDITLKFHDGKATAKVNKS